MKGLSIGRSELVSRFVASERGRLSRSLESMVFAVEMQNESQLLLGHSTSAISPPVPVADKTFNSLGFSPTPSSILGSEVAEKAHLEIADPLLVQEILATFHVRADLMKKAASLTGDERALPLDELITILENSQTDSCGEEFSTEYLSDEVFRKLLDAIRWSDDKHKALAQPQALVRNAAHDLSSVTETLKSFLAATANQQQNTHTEKNAHLLSSTKATVLSPEEFGPAGVADASAEDLAYPPKPQPFSVWSNFASDRASGDFVLENVQEVERSGEKAASAEILEPGDHDNQQALGSQIHIENPALEVLSTPSNGLEEASQAFAGPNSIQETTLRQYADKISPLIAVPADTADLSAAEAGFEESKPVVFRPLNPSVPGTKEFAFHDHIPDVSDSSADVQRSSGPDAMMVSWDPTGDVLDIVSEPSEVFDPNSLEDLVEARILALGRNGASTNSSGGDPSPFGGGSAESREGLLEPNPQGVPAGGTAFPNVAVQHPLSTAESETPMTLSFLQEEWPSHLGQKLTHLARSGKSSMMLELEPENLGKLIVRVETDGTRVSAVVQTEHPTVREMLQRSMTSLREVLADQGLQLTQFSVDVRQGSASFAEGNPTPWLHNDSFDAISPADNGSPEKAMNVLHVLDVGTGRALSVHV